MERNLKQALEALSESGSASDSLGFVKVGDSAARLHEKGLNAEKEYGLFEGERIVAEFHISSFECPHLSYYAEELDVIVTNYRMKILLEDEVALYKKLTNVPLTLIIRIVQKGTQRTGYKSYFSTALDFRLEIRTKDCRYLILRFKNEAERLRAEGLLNASAFFCSKDILANSAGDIHTQKLACMFAFAHYQALPESKKNRRTSASSGSNLSTSPSKTSGLKVSPNQVSTSPGTKPSRGISKGPNSAPKDLRTYIYSPDRELARLGGKALNLVVSEVNADYALCDSYPERFILPSEVSIEMAKRSSEFRSSRRLPAVCWFNAKTGVTLSRCSQPQTGLSSNCSSDETLVALLHAKIETPPQSPQVAPANPFPNQSFYGKSLHNTGSIYKSSTFSFNSTSTQLPPEAVKLLIVDARSNVAAGANMVKGGGYEDSKKYRNSKIQFMDIGNIHDMRASWKQYSEWMMGVTSFDRISIEHTQWPAHFRGIMKAADLVADALVVQKQSVLVHCSDGWDRTSQIVSLAQLLIDPYYRTMEGFSVLIQKDWIAFGHKFFDRLGHGVSDSPDTCHEQSPIFLQWMEVVFQLMDQFPNWFEFNEEFLLRIIDEAYSCRFGDFLANSDREAKKILKIHEKTLSIWDALVGDSAARAEFINPDYVLRSAPIKPETSTSHFQTWSAFFERYRLSMVPTHEYIESNRKLKMEKQDVQMLSTENQVLKTRLEDAEAILKELLKKDPALLKGVQEKVLKVLEGGGDRKEIGFEISTRSDGSISAQMRDLFMSPKKPNLTASQEFVGAKKLIEGDVDVADNYLGESPEPIPKSSASDNLVEYKNVNVTNPTDPFVGGILKEEPMIVEDYVIDDDFISHRSRPTSNYIRRPAGHYYSERNNELADSKWTYNGVKKYIIGYLPRSYISALRVLAEFPNHYYVTFPIDKLSDWLAKNITQ